MLCELLYTKTIFIHHISRREISIASRENRLREKLARGLVGVLKNQSSQIKVSIICLVGVGLDLGLGLSLGLKGQSS